MRRGWRCRTGVVRIRLIRRVRMRSGWKRRWIRPLRMIRTKIRRLVMVLTGRIPVALILAVPILAVPILAVPILAGLTLAGLTLVVPAPALLAPAIPAPAG